MVLEGSFLLVGHKKWKASPGEGDRSDDRSEVISRLRRILRSLRSDAAALYTRRCMYTLPFDKLTKLTALNNSVSKLNVCVGSMNILFLLLLSLAGCFIRVFLHFTLLKWY